jgi:hypothetical protein
MNVKEIAHQLADSLSDDSTWEDLIYKIYVRKVIEQGLDQSQQEQVHSSQAIREHFGITRAQN